jgi:hypothetical protein
MGTANAIIPWGWDKKFSFPAVKNYNSKVRDVLNGRIYYLPIVLSMHFNSNAKNPIDRLTSYSTACRECGLPVHEHVNGE